MGRPAERAFRRCFPILRFLPEAGVMTRHRTRPASRSASRKNTAGRPADPRPRPDPPEAMLEECHKRLEGRVSPEFLRCQIEVARAYAVHRRGARRLGASARDGGGGRGRSRAGAHCGGHTSLRLLDRAEADRARAVPHARARHAGARAAAHHLRAACACRTRGPELRSTCWARSPISCRTCSRSRPPRPSGAATIPGSRATGRGLRRDAAHRPAGELRFLRRVPAPVERAGAQA